MVPDPQAIRGLARQVSEQAGRTRAAATRMRAAEHIQYQSAAADRYRRDLRSAVSEADHAVRELEEAAAALLRHAGEVERRLADIAKLERWFRDRVADARREVAQMADGASRMIDSTTEDLLRAARNAPAPGSPQWLDFGRQFGR